MNLNSIILLETNKSILVLYLPDSAVIFSQHTKIDLS